MSQPLSNPSSSPHPYVGSKAGGSSSFATHHGRFLGGSIALAVASRAKPFLPRVQVIDPREISRRAVLDTQMHLCDVPPAHLPYVLAHLNKDASFDRLELLYTGSLQRAKEMSHVAKVALGSCAVAFIVLAAVAAFTGHSPLLEGAVAGLTLTALLFGIIYKRVIHKYEKDAALAWQASQNLQNQGNKDV